MQKPKKFLPQTNLVPARGTQIKPKQFLYLCSSDFHLWPILFVLIFASITSAQTTQPQALSPKSTVDEILDALDSRGKDLQDFSAKVVLTDTDASTGESTTNTGTCIFQRKGK